MSFIVLDLEWNQCCAPGMEDPEMPFEIIEIGAVKMAEDFSETDSFSRLVRPVVYKQINRITSKLVHLEMRDLLHEETFPAVAEDFLAWCGDDPTYCVWGGLDLTELQRNLQYHVMDPLSDGPIAYFDVQKMFSLAYEDGKSRRALEVAVDMLEIEKTLSFHRAYSDAYYTAEILKRIAAEHPDVLKKISFDLYHPPMSRDKEVKIVFDTYAKYVSRCFDTKTDAFADREVSSSKCYLCRRNLRKKLKWFSANSKHYYCLAYCEKHGYLKGKIRVRKLDDGRVFVVKTTKLISEEESQELRQKAIHAREMKKKHTNRTGTTT